MFRARLVKRLSPIGLRSFGVSKARFNGQPAVNPHVSVWRFPILQWLLYWLDSPREHSTRTLVSRWLKCYQLHLVHTMVLCTSGNISKQSLRPAILQQSLLTMQWALQARLQITSEGSQATSTSPSTILWMSSTSYICYKTLKIIKCMLYISCIVNGEIFVSPWPFLPLY